MCMSFVNASHSKYCITLNDTLIFKLIYFLCAQMAVIAIIMFKALHPGSVRQLWGSFPPDYGHSSNPKLP